MVAGALVMIVPASSRADDKATRDAQARFEEGLGRVKAGDFEAARISFAQAYAVLHKPDILWNLALSEQKSGHYVEAIGHFKQLARDATSDADRTNAKKHVSELMPQTGHVEVLAPDGSKVSVDGAPAGVTPLADTVDVSPGHHHLEARTPQGTKTADTDVTAGQVAHVSFMVATAPAGAGQPGAADPAAGAGATAAVGAAALPGPSAGEGASPATSPGGDVAPDTVSPDGGMAAGHARIITVAVVGGLAVVAGGMGLGFGLASNSHANQADTLRQQNPSCAGSTSAGCQQLADTVSSQHDDAVLSRVFWVTGGVLAVGAVATWFLWPKTSHVAASTASFTVIPSAGPGSVGAAVMGSF